MYKQQLYVDGSPTCLQISDTSTNCNSGMVCKSLDTHTNEEIQNEILYIFIDRGEDFAYIHEDCEIGFDVKYVSAPQHCHQLNGMMRQYLKGQGISNQEMNSICYISGDQW